MKSGGVVLGITLCCSALLSGGCAAERELPAASAEPNRQEVPQADLAQLATDEVVELHRFIEQWSLAELEDTDAVYARFADALDDSFVLIGPDGARSDESRDSGSAESSVVVGFRSAHGRWRGLPEAHLEIREANARVLGERLVLVDYEEWHFLGGEPSVRRSSVVMREDPAAPGGVSWLHLHETWIVPPPEARE